MKKPSGPEGSSRSISARQTRATTTASSSTYISPAPTAVSLGRASIPSAAGSAPRSPKSLPKGENVVIVDDSIVRGTTITQLVSLVRKAGAEQIHVRVTAPPIRHPCHYGMDFPSEEELIANRCGGDVEQVRKELGVDSLGYLSLEKLLASVPRNGAASYCTACFSGEYPTPIESAGSKDENEI